MNIALLESMIGLAKVCANNTITDNASKLILTGLRLSSEDDAEDLRTQIIDEKNRIAPDCMTCAHRCGNSDDYDMRTIGMFGPETKVAKEQLICALHRYATKDDPDIELIFRALNFIDFGYEPTPLIELAEKLL